MYFNSSRLLPVHSKNKPISVPKVKNQPKKLNPTERKHKSKHDKKNKKTDVPEPQLLPNGEKPNFGNQNNDKSGSSSGKKPSRPKKHSKQEKQFEQQSVSESTDRLTQTLKDLLLKSQTSSSSASPMINNNNRVAVTSNNDIASTISPLNTPSTIPAALLNPMGLSPIPQQQHQQPQLMTPPIMHPGLYPQQTLSPFAYQQQYQNSPQPPPLIHGNGSSIPGTGGGYPFQGYPYVSNVHYSLTSGTNNQMPNNAVSPTPAHMNLMFPYSNNNNGNNLSTMHVPPLSSSSSTSRQIQHSAPHTAMASPSTNSKPTSRSNSRPTSNASFNSRSPPKKNNVRRGSQSFAGASFATAIPQECNLPKPSFT